MVKTLLIGFIACALIGLLVGLVLHLVGVTSPGIVGAICGGLGGFIAVRIFTSKSSPKT